MAVLQFRFDESFTKRFMSVGGWIAEQEEWERLEISWQRHIDRCNFKNRPNQKISRAHASQMDKFKKEFEHWDAEMASQFQKKLIGLIAKRSMVGITIGADLDAMQSEFPGNTGTKERHWRSYSLCIKFIMNEVGRLMARLRPDDQVHIVHDHGNWDVQALQAYNTMVDDQRWQYRTLFTGITWKTGGQCVGLQASDLIVYEAHKAMRQKVVHNSDELGAAVALFLHKKVPVIARYLDAGSVRALSSELKKSKGLTIDAIK